VAASIGDILATTGSRLLYSIACVAQHRPVQAGTVAGHGFARSMGSLQAIRPVPDSGESGNAPTRRRGFSFGKRMGRISCSMRTYAAADELREQIVRVDVLYRQTTSSELSVGDRSMIVRAGGVSDPTIKVAGAVDQWLIGMRWVAN
jgi:hypothetical protein